MRGHYQMLINGEHADAADGDTLATIDPATGLELARVPRGGREDVDRAVRAANAESVRWSALPGRERARLLNRLADALMSAQDELAATETRDNGKPLAQSRNDVKVAAQYFAYYAGLADKLEGRHIPLEGGAFAFTEYKPYGVVGIVVPWNAPINQAARSAAPALAAGNTVVIKPAEDTPLSAIRLAEIATEIGFPAGVLNVVTGYGREAGQFLVEHEMVRMISFTGSVETGRHIGRVAADRVVPVTLELGGKSANIVFADADLAEVAKTIGGTIVKNAGQVCSAATRVLVQREAVDELLAATSEQLAGLTSGPGIEDPALGPLVSRRQMERVLDYVRIGDEEGAVRVAGGQRLQTDATRNGFFVAPTIFRDVRPEMTISQEEIFGPVVAVIAFDTEDDAVRIANGTRYGLTAGVVTKDIARAFRVASRMEAGQVFINRWHAGGIETPFGGYKHSGIGREKGADAIHHYSQLRTTIVAP